MVPLRDRHERLDDPTHLVQLDGCRKGIEVVLGDHQVVQLRVPGFGRVDAEHENRPRRHRRMRGAPWMLSADAVVARSRWGRVRMTP